MVIDLQVEYVSGGDLLNGQSSGILDAFPELPANVASLLAKSRAANLPIVHIRGRDHPESSKWLPWWNKLHTVGAGAGTTCLAEPWACEIPGEPVFIKHAYDAFASDEVTVELLGHLRKLGIKTIYMAGCLTKACVMFTANSAFTLGFEVYILSDCCADRSREHHDAVLQMYDGYHIKVVTRHDIPTTESET
jgi:nicotinamidase-related amidase